MSNALYGLQDLGGVIRKEDHILILSVLFENVNRVICGEDSIIPNCHGLVFNNLIKLHEAITLSKYNLHTILKQNHYKSWEKMNRFLADEITLRRRDGCNYYDQINIETDAEKKMTSMVVGKIDNTDVIMKSNELASVMSTKNDEDSIDSNEMLNQSHFDDQADLNLTNDNISIQKIIDDLEGEKNIS